MKKHLKIDIRTNLRDDEVAILINGLTLNPEEHEINHKFGRGIAKLVDELYAERRKLESSKSN